MPKFTIHPDGLVVTDDAGDTMELGSDHPQYLAACNAVMLGDWALFKDIAFSSVLNVAEPETDEFGSFVLADIIGIVTGLLQDELITPEDIGISIPATQHGANHEHDLSQWSGSPIFYPTREMAREQSDRWGMFWEYHDFGITAPAGYRYATVPRLGMAPTAPDGYDWVCLSREED